MLVDKTTLNDLSIFHHEEEQSVFHYLNHTRTINGKDWLKQMLSKPLGDIKSIEGVQSVIKELLLHIHSWPETITNGTIMVIETIKATTFSAGGQDLYSGHEARTKARFRSGIECLRKYSLLRPCGRHGIEIYELEHDGFLLADQIQAERVSLSN